MRIRLFWSPPGEISATGCWVLFHGPYLYTGATPWSALRQWACEHGDDRHLVG